MSQDWESVSSVTMLEVVQLKWLIVSEFTLFKALENWGLSQVAAHGGNLSALLLPLLQHVRFRLMTVADFCRVSMRSNVLSIEQQLMIVRCLALNNPDFLPPEFDKTNM
jgi:hypothetical protein